MMGDVGVNNAGGATTAEANNMMGGMNMMDGMNMMGGINMMGGMNMMGGIRVYIVVLFCFSLGI